MMRPLFLVTLFLVSSAQADDDSHWSLNPEEAKRARAEYAAEMKKRYEAQRKEPVYVVPAEKGDTLLYGKTCDLVKEQWVAVTLWTKRLEPSRKLPQNPPDCVKDAKSGLFFVSLETVLPARAKERLTQPANCHGPNCLNTAVRLSGHDVGFRYTGSGEFVDYLTERCKPVLERAKLEPGDIVVIGSRERAPGIVSPSHAFVWLSENLSFEKVGMSREEPTQFWAPDAILKHREVAKACFLPPIQLPKECAEDRNPNEKIARAYRCEGTDSAAKAVGEAKKMWDAAFTTERLFDTWAKEDRLPTVKELETARKRVAEALAPYPDTTGGGGTAKITEEVAPALQRLRTIDDAFFHMDRAVRTRFHFDKLKNLKLQDLLQVEPDYDKTSNYDLGNYETAWQTALLAHALADPDAIEKELGPTLGDPKNKDSERRTREVLRWAIDLRPALEKPYGKYATPAPKN